MNRSGVQFPSRALNVPLICSSSLLSTALGLEELLASVWDEVARAIFDLGAEQAGAGVPPASRCLDAVPAGTRGSPAGVAAPR